MRRLALLLVVISLGIPIQAQARGWRAPRQESAEEILSRMSPRERVAQLFMVTFNGSSFDQEDDIYKLVADWGISGVILRRGKDNLVETPDTIAALKDLTADLQRVRFEASALGAQELEGSSASPGGGEYIPLFIAMEHAGGHALQGEIIEGVSPIPSQMSLGATWNAQFAERAGQALGAELEAIGINLLIGPSLDVLENPQITRPGDLGVRSFGGDPFWVGVMGEAFISGVHKGSGGRMAVIGTHFPGLGSSDRPAQEEVATVRKSLEQLKQIELAPFFSVTQSPPGEAPSALDGVLTAHIRYQGFTGNIRATTRPVSLDPQAFGQLMSLEPLKQWREGGGIAMSDSLGAKAIRRFRDPREQLFPAHLVARDAFLAGNDLLWLEDFRDPREEDEYATILGTLQFFASKYEEDASFAARVDESVLRILQLKLRLYGGEYSYQSVQDALNGVEAVGSRNELGAEVAANAATLISPSLEEIEDRVGGKPRIGERIVFFTDMRYERQCAVCRAKPIMEKNALESAILRLYGPGAAGEVGGWNLRSYSTADLANYLGDVPQSTPEVPLASAEEVDEALGAADWLVFSILDTREEAYGANALKLLLDQRPDLARSKKLVVFAHDVPYILDATDISKLDVFYALFDADPPFIEAAAKLLFGELAPVGSAPVSVPGIGYDLIDVLSPDPNQVIELFLKLPEGVEGEESPPGFTVGDVAQVETGVILDANGHPVPDKTPVEFIVTLQIEGIPTYTMVSDTVGGIARATVPLDRTGLLSITAQSGKARNSQTLQLNVQQDVFAQATVISPTLAPTDTPAPTSTPFIEATATPSEAGEGPEAQQEGKQEAGMGEFFLALIAAVAVGGLGFAVSVWSNCEGMLRLRWAALPVMFALAAYNYLAWGLPGSASMLEGLGHASAFILPILAGGLGLAIVRRLCRAGYSARSRIRSGPSGAERQLGQEGRDREGG